MLKRSSRLTGLVCLLALSLISLAAASEYVPWTPFASAQEQRASADAPEMVLQTQSDSVLRLPLATNDIVFNPQDNLLYATRPSSAGQNGNSLSRINPLTGDVIGSVYVGSEPNQIALSEDGLTLYVSLDGAYSIRRYNTLTHEPGLQFSAGRRTYSGANNAPVRPTDMAVAPGNPNLLAITTEYPDRRVVAFNNGVELPNRGYGADYLAFSNSSTLFGSGGYQTGLLKFAVSETGIADVTGNPSSFWAYKLKFQNGLLFDAAGRIIDANTRTLLGTCIPSPSTHPAVTNTYPFVPDTATGRVLYAVKENFTDVTIKAFDINTYLQIGSITVPNVGYETVPTELLRYGTNGLAMRTSDNQLYFIQTSLIPTENPLPTPTGTPVVMPTPTPTPTPHARFIRELTLPNKDLLYRSTDRKFYATVPTVSGNEYANSLIRIEPSTGAIENSVVVGSQPGRLAFSEDGQVLYIGINGENAVKKFDMQTQTSGLQFPLGVGTNGPKTAYDIEVLPGDPNAVAVSYGTSSYNYDGADIYDNGVKRAQKANLSGAITVGSPQTLYVGDGYLSKYGISSAGLSLQESFVTSGSGESIIIGNLLYSSGGAVLDLTTKDFVGSYTGVGYWAGLTIDVPNNRIFFLSNDSGGAPLGATIRAYRLDNFLPIGSIPLPGVHISHQYGETPRRFFRWGENGLAFTDYNNKIYFVQSDLVSSSEAVPTAIQLSSQVSSGSETAGTVPVTIVRSGGTTGTSTIGYATVDGTATAGADYTASSGTVTFAPGESSKIVNVPIINDTVFEGSETFSFVLSNPGGDGQVELLEPSSRVLTISDNDGQPSISGANISVMEPLTGTSTATFTVQLSNPTTQTATVNYATANGTATADSDYVPTSGTLTFAPLETAKTIEVQVLADQISESNETFRINFTNSVNAWINTSQVTGTIVNYNPNPTPTPTPTPTATPTPTPTPTPVPVFVRRVNLPVNDFVYSNSPSSIYASVPSSAGAGLGNTITKINPVSGAIGASVFVGSEPNRMVISDDGRTAYVKLDGAKSIRRFDVLTQTAGLQFPLLGQFLYLEDWAVQPGHPQVLAVSSLDGVAIYDNGVQRPVIDDGDALHTDTITFAGPTTIFGYDDSTTAADLVRFTVTDSGVDGVRVRSVTGLGNEIEYSNGLLYGSYGRVVDLGGTVVGTFQGGGGLMAIDQPAGRIFFLAGNTLTAYNIYTFAKIGSTTVPGLGPIGRLVRWGENGLAVRCGIQLCLIQSPLVSPTGSLPTGMQFSSQTASGSESSSTAQVNVTRNGDLSGTSTVNYSTSSGTAMSGIDFAATSGTLVFAAGETTKTISVPLINDNITEGSETLTISLSDPAGSGSVEIVFPGTTTLTIQDSDSAPSVFTPNISVMEPEPGGTLTVPLAVQLTNPSTQTVTVDYTTVSGTATPGLDYIHASGTLTFAPMEVFKSVPIQIRGDALTNETSENFRINFSNATNAFVNNSLGSVTITNFVQTLPKIAFDYEGDGRADPSVWRPSDNFWYLKRSTAGFMGTQWGTPGDRPAPADYDGDGKTDIAVFRPSEGAWYVIMSASQTLQAFAWGENGDLPVPADHNGDGKADLVVYRESNNTFYKTSTTASFFVGVQFGIGGDKPVIGDFDADGKADVAVYRPSNRNWYVLRSLGGFTAQEFGEPGDIPTPADFDGDGATDPAVFRPSTGVWYRTRSTGGGYDSVSWGQNGDIPVAADYDGDGKADAAVFRPSEGMWYLNCSTAGLIGIPFGQSGDIPTPSAFIY